MATDHAAELGELLDALGHLRTDDEDGEGGPRGPGRGRRFEALAGSSAGRPVAVTLAVAAQLLGAPPSTVHRAAQAIRPYRHNDGTPRWSLRQLELALGQRPRTGNGAGQGNGWRGQR